MKNILSAILIILITQFSIAQELPSISTTDKSKKPIELCDLQLSVFIIDNVATTTIEMQFYNDNNEVMEGEFNFPLANGVAISRFALDVNGKMREGVVVDKQKAIQAFEAITRRNVDPGLAEVTKGNNFKARVYPIPAKGYKKAVIAFEQEINGDDKNYIYKLPLRIKNKLENFSVKVEVVNNKPKVLENNNSAINLKFTKARNSYISEFQKSNISLKNNLIFAVPKPKKINTISTYRGFVTSDNYFYANLPLQPEWRKKKTPKDIAIIWDVSSSAKNRDLDKELEILKAYLKWMKEGRVQLITFSNTIHLSKNYKVLDGKSDKLINALQSISYDGGTNIHAVNFSKLDADEALLVTDGISNFGTKRSFSFKQPVTVINSSNIANHNLLEYYAKSSKGTYINASEKSIDEAIKITTYEQKQFIKATFNSEKIKDVFPLVGEKVKDYFSLSGKVIGEKPKVTLHFGFGSKITESKTLIIDNINTNENTLGERIWAQKKLKTLLVNKNVSAITEHGTKFNLVTPYTSLIVLDDVEDYVQYEIVPPLSLQQEYFSRIATRDKRRKEFKEDRFSRLCDEFNLDFESWKNTINYRNVNLDTVQSKPSLPQTQYLEHSIVESDDIEIDDVELEEEVAFEMIDNSKTEKKNNKEKRTKSKITIKAWDSNAPYMSALKSAKNENIYLTYLKTKMKYQDNPSFYFDAATLMFQRSLKKEGLRVLSNLAELELENTELLRILGRKLLEFNFYDEAIAIFKEVLEIRSFEPHSYMDLGLAYAEKKEYQKAISYLYTVIEKDWDADIISRFNGIELIVLHDINSIIAQNKKLETSFINSCFLKNMPVDIRIVIDWDANETDIDLWVTDPFKEKCSYENKKTKIGGKISNDITRGYGPEEFRLKHAIDGSYRIESKFYGTSKQTVTGKVTIRAIVYTNFGSKRQRKELLTLQVASQKGATYKIGAIEFIK